MQYQFRPIHEWPGEKTKSRRRSTFSASWSRTLVDLDRELQHLKAEGLIIQAAAKESEIRLDGMLRSDARPTWPGVILSFESKIGPLSYPCDTYLDWQANVRAIALALAALCAVDRYGVTRRAEQYKGWARLEAPKSIEPQTALDVLTSAAACRRVQFAEVHRDRSLLATIYKTALFATHPDQGGNPDDFRRVQDAKTSLDKWLEGR